MAWLKNAVSLVSDALNAADENKAEKDLKKRSEDLKAKAKASKKSKVIWKKEFPQSGTFRGYRRIKLTTYKEELVSETLAHFRRKGNDFKGSTITLENIAVKDVFVDRLMKVVNVYADGFRIGCVYDGSDDRYSMLTEYEYDKVHLKVENDDVFLFVHYPVTAPLKTSYRTE